MATLTFPLHCAASTYAEEVRMNVLYPRCTLLLGAAVIVGSLSPLLSANSAGNTSPGVVSLGSGGRAEAHATSSRPADVRNQERTARV